MGCSFQITEKPRYYNSRWKVLYENIEYLHIYEYFLQILLLLTEWHNTVARFMENFSNTDGNIDTSTK